VCIARRGGRRVLIASVVCLFSSFRSLCAAVSVPLDFDTRNRRPHHSRRRLPVSVLLRLILPLSVLPLLHLTGRTQGDSSVAAPILATTSVSEGSLSRIKCETSLALSSLTVLAGDSGDSASGQTARGHRTQCIPRCLD
jgi:hypothetical protein